VYPPLRITSIRTWPLHAEIPERFGWSLGWTDHRYTNLVEIRTDEGITGWGEGATGWQQYRLIGKSAFEIAAAWETSRMPTENLQRQRRRGAPTAAGVDIALWDIVGKAMGQPIYRLLGGMGHRAVPAYASSINWLGDDVVEREVAAALEQGFREIKVKIGQTAGDAIKRAEFIRRLVGDEVVLYADANWAFDVHEAIRVGQALGSLGYGFFEEPIVPHDRLGYRRLAEVLPIRLAAGESDFLASEAAELIADRSIGLVQPDVARSGGITETWRIAELAAVFHTAYAPHVGWSGAVCEAASLHLASAAPATRTFERMVFPNPLREDLCIEGPPPMIDGKVTPPEGPGLGIVVDRAKLDHYRLK